VGLGEGLGASLLLIADCRCTIPRELGSGYRSQYTTKMQIRQFLHTFSPM